MRLPTPTDMCVGVPSTGSFSLMVQLTGPTVVQHFFSRLSRVTLADKGHRVPGSRAVISVHFHEGTTMNKLQLTAIAIVSTMALSFGAIAQSLSKDEYKASKDKIAADYKGAKTACKSLSGNANDICVAEAKGQENIAKAELEARYKPTAKNQSEVYIAKAEAGYALAKEKCDDLAGSAKDSCISDAKLAQANAKAAAKPQKK